MEVVTQKSTVEFSVDHRPLGDTPHHLHGTPDSGRWRDEDDLVGEGAEYVVGRANYADSAMCRARKLDEGFLKVLAGPDGDDEILGAHAVGNEVSLLHEAVVAMRTGTSVAEVADTIHAHRGERGSRGGVP